MFDVLVYVLPYFVEYRYWAIFFALVVAGFGVPLPEELTILVSGYLTAVNYLDPAVTLLACYTGVLAGDIVTYCIGRFGASYLLESKFARWLISPKKLEQIQYYYRGYGPIYLLGARQVAGLRFPSFFTAGMVRMDFFKFILFDGLAALVSVPGIFLIAYYFGPRLRDALNFVLDLRETTLVVGVTLLLVFSVGFFVYWYFFDRKNDE